MWLGVLSDGPDDDVLVTAYPQRRVFTVAAPAAAVPQMIRIMREVNDGQPTVPRCRACLEPLDVPDLEDECASA